MKEKVKIQLVLIVVLTFFAMSLILAPHAGPDNSPLFALKRVQEKVFLEMQFNPESKLKYMSSILNSRLEELSSIVNNRKYDYVLTASRKYFTLAGQITEYATANNLTNQTEDIKDQFLNHQKVLDRLYVIYPKNIPENEEWKYIKDDYNYLGLYLEQLSKIK